MAKSFCNGCRHWIWVKQFDGKKFRCCIKHGDYTLSARKKFCNGDLWEEL